MPDDKDFNEDSPEQEINFGERSMMNEQLKDLNSYLVEALPVFNYSEYEITEPDLKDFISQRTVQRLLHTYENNGYETLTVLAIDYKETQDLKDKRAVDAAINQTILPNSAKDPVQRAITLEQGIRNATLAKSNAEKRIERAKDRGSQRDLIEAEKALEAAEEWLESFEELKKTLKKSG
jgi:hypothetical protein